MEGDIRNEMEPCRREGIKSPRVERERTRLLSGDLLDISKEIDRLINSKGWSWCDMRQVYRILEVIHG